MSRDKKQQARILGLIVGLIAVLIGGLLFMGAVSSWFEEDKIILDPEYVNIEYNSESDSFYGLLDAKSYDDLIKLKKSFIVFVDQGGCDAADRLREYVGFYAKEHNIAVYKMMFSEVKGSSLYNYVKYYPSVVLISNGTPRWYLKADSDDDAEKYNSYDVFEKWMNQYI